MRIGDRGGHAATGGGTRAAGEHGGNVCDKTGNNVWSTHHDREQVGTDHKLR